jgi:hypothetical protein
VSPLDHAGHQLLAVTEVIGAGAVLGLVGISWLHLCGLRWTWALAMSPLAVLAWQVDASAGAVVAIGVGLAAASELRASISRRLRQAAIWPTARGPGAGHHTPSKPGARARRCVAAATWRPKAWRSGAVRMASRCGSRLRQRPAAIA